MLNPIHRAILRASYHIRQEKMITGFPLTRHPSRHARSAEASHVLQSGTAHGEVTNEVPDEGAELEDGGKGSEDEVLELRDSQR